MQIFDHLWFLAKVLLLIIILYILSILYKFIYLPWRIRNKYKQYPNVAMNKKFTPMLGDVATIMKSEKENYCALTIPLSLMIEV